MQIAHSMLVPNNSFARHISMSARSLFAPYADLGLIVYFIRALLRTVDNFTGLFFPEALLVFRYRSLCYPCGRGGVEIFSEDCPETTNTASFLITSYLMPLSFRDQFLKS